MKDERVSGLFAGLTVLLVVAIVGGVVLVLLLTRPPSTTDVHFEVGQPVASTCPVGSGATVCYRFEVHNMGGGDGVAHCTAVAAPDTTATISGGDGVADVAIGSGDSRTVFVGVAPDPGATASAPALTCA